MRNETGGVFVLAGAAQGEHVSPVTLSEDWSRLARLLLLASLAAVGSVGNVFMISAVMIDDYLRRRGNTFIVNVALADLLVSGLVVPASAVVILAGLRNSLAVCRLQWFVAALCLLVSAPSLAAAAAESYARLCCSPAAYARLTRRRITAALLAVWALAAAASAMQFAPGLSFDYCTRRYLGFIPYQVSVGVALVFAPIAIALFLYARIAWHVRRTRRQPNFKPPPTFHWDHALMTANLCSFLAFLLFWLPFGAALAAGARRPIPNSVFYSLAWLGISRSCVNSVLYCLADAHFRSAYVNLFHYCCCKTTVSFGRRQRPDPGGAAAIGGAAGAVRPSGDVRVHIIPGYNMYCSPQRAGREGGVGGKRGAGREARQNGRDVYEL